MKKKCKRNPLCQILGIIIAIIGTAIIIQIIPVKAWMLILGGILIVLGFRLFTSC